MRRPPGLLRGVLVLAGLCVALPAAGYSLTGTFWTWQDDPIEDPFPLDVGSFPADAGDTGEITDALTGAMDSWNDLGLDAVLSYGGHITGATLDADGHSYLQYGTYAGVGAALAFAASWTYEDGALFDCDVFFLSSNDYGALAWDADPAGAASGRYDIQATALHELGHCLGLDHSDDPSAVMYAYYAGLRELAADDVAGVTAIYGPGCDDGDGDGTTACAGDCDDANALIGPSAIEICDGVDNDCDGVVDADQTVTQEIADGAMTASAGWLGVGNVVRIDAPTALVSARAHLQVDEGTRLNWSIYRSDDEGASWTRVRTDLAWATADTHQESPVFRQPLEVGAWYAIAVGAESYSVRAQYDASPSLDPTGLLTPIGGIYDRPMGDQRIGPDASRLYDQELVLVADRDADDDGQTALCGDCDPEDATVYAGAPEVCDGLDQGCDGGVDEGFTDDADADGALDCVDPCPLDAADDADADGACADADPCPDDPEDRCDDPVDTGGPGDTDTPDDSGAPPDSASGDPEDAEPPDDATKTPEGCGCATRPADGAGLAGLAGLALLAARRRRGPGAPS